MKSTIKIKTTFILKNFEEISESQENKLIGGFSSSVRGGDKGLDDGNTNNCNGGNCNVDCGLGQNIQCNTIAGCGK